MDYFKMTIEILKKDNGGVEDETIRALRAKREELGEGASEDEILDAITSVLEERTKPSAGLSEDDKAYMAETTATIQEYLDSRHLKYEVKELRADFVVHEMGVKISGDNLRVRICVEAKPKACHFEAVFPFTAKKLYEYPLCRMLAKENHIRRFGAFEYNERDGEVSYNQAVLATHGIHKDDVEAYFMVVIETAHDCYDAIAKCCVGKFKRKEIEEITRKAEELIDDINE